VIIWSNPPTQECSPRTGYLEPCPDSFWISPKIKTLQYPWATYATAWSLSQ